jgi:hypothetical protein
VGIVRHHCPPAIHGPRFRPTSLVVLILLVATVSLAAGCGRTNAAPVAKVVQEDVPVVSERVATLDGYVNARPIMRSRPVLYGRQVYLLQERAIAWVAVQVL